MMMPQMSAASTVERRTYGGAPYLRWSAVPTAERRTYGGAPYLRRSAALLAWLFAVEATFAILARLDELLNRGLERADRTVDRPMSGWTYVWTYAVVRL